MLSIVVSFGATACLADDDEGPPGDASAYVGRWVFTQGMLRDFACEGRAEPIFSHPLATREILISSSSVGRLDVSFMGCNLTGLDVFMDGARLPQSTGCHVEGKMTTATGVVQHVELTLDGELLKVEAGFDSSITENDETVVCHNLVLDGAVAERADGAP